ncbi:MAG: 6-bladed beta-propeller [Tannerellaceae bacterium]|nr:6-bladed beta-propeller [Tannerellaceae bacterium]
MKKILFILLVFLFFSCQHNRKPFSNFAVPSELNSNSIPIVKVDSGFTKRIVVNKPLEKVFTSELIEEFFYIPLETNTEDAFIGYYYNVIFHNGYIYILDIFSANAVLIYNTNGQFIKKIGTKGGGPEEYGILLGMCIDKQNDYLLIYDNGKRRIMYYTLEGEYIKYINVPFRFSGRFQVMPSGDLVAVTSQCQGNFHLGEYDKYRLIYMDSTSVITKFGYEYDDNLNLSIGWSNIFDNGRDYSYYPQYLNSIYNVSDTLLLHKYEIDCNYFDPFDINKISEYSTMKSFDKDWDSHTSLDPYMAETDSHFYFVINDERKKYYYFYDKESENLIGFKDIKFDNEFVIDELFTIFNNDEYFIGMVSPNKLLDLKKYKEMQNTPLSENLSKMIDSLDEEDNKVLVLFKVKKL